MKRVNLMLIISAMLITFSGCGTAGPFGNGLSPEKIDELMQSVAPTTEQVVSTTEQMTEVATEQTTQTQENDQGQDVFKKATDTYIFSSGAGAWQTEMELKSDGSFSGVYSDSNMGETGKGYPNGTVYESKFRGKFVNVKKESEYAYSMEITDVILENKVDTEEIIDGVKYYYCNPYGLDGGKTFKLYLPGEKTGNLPQGVFSWDCSGVCQNVSELPGCVIYNMEQQCALISNTLSDYGAAHYDEWNQDDYSDDDDDYSYEDDSYSTYEEPFYGIWVNGSEDESYEQKYVNDLIDKGFYDAACYDTFDWSNLNVKRLYVVSAGRYATEKEAKKQLKKVKKYYKGAYIKYTGDYIGY